VLAAVLGDVAGDLGRVGGANRLDVGRVRALVDSSKKACWRSCDCDAGGDGQNGEDGGLCEHGVDFVVVFVGRFVFERGRVSRESEKVVFEGNVKKRLLK